MNADALLKSIAGRTKRFRDQEQSLKLSLDKQLVGIHNHIRHIRESHRDVGRNSERAKGHLQEAIRISLKLRRLYENHGV